MKINKKIPGLPDWPAIEQVKKTDFIVRSKHLTYEKMGSGYGLVLILAVVLCCVNIIVGFAFAILAMPMMPLFREMFFLTNLTMRFTSTQIIFNRTVYEMGPSVQFRANRHAMNEDLYRRRSAEVQSGKYSYKATPALHYRKIEMIYGARLVLLTTMADHEKAEQFVIGLQCAYDLARPQSTQSRGGTVIFEDLPE